MITIYQPTNLAHTILALAFYLIVAGFAVYSFLALYALNRFGYSKRLTATVSIGYLLLAGGLYVLAQSDLDRIQF